MKKIQNVFSLVILLIVAACNGQEEKGYEMAEKNGCKLHAYVNHNSYKVKKICFDKEQQEVKNIILMIGDGMGLNVVQAAWTANKGQLFLDNAGCVGLMRTTAQDSIITDSAAAGTAMATGTKTKRGYVGVDAAGNSLKTICEYAKEKGLATGVLSSCRIYDATPATFSVENKDRNNSDAIAEAYLDCDIDFVLGGGLDHFQQHKAGKDLLPLLEKKGYEVVTSIEDLPMTKSDKIFALVAEHDMPIATDRDRALWKSTKKALDVLASNEKGFFLMVESAMIDDFGHGNKLPEMMEETLDFDRTIGKTLEWAVQHTGTLVIVTADHATGGLTLTEGSLEKGEIKGYFSSGHHDGVMVPVYAFGPKVEQFGGIYENTELCKKIKTALGL